MLAATTQLRSSRLALILEAMCSMIKVVAAANAFHAHGDCVSASNSLQCRRAPCRRFWFPEGWRAACWGLGLHDCESVALPPLEGLLSPRRRSSLSAAGRIRGGEGCARDLLSRARTVGARALLGASYLMAGIQIDAPSRARDARRYGRARPTHYLAHSRTPRWRSSASWATRLPDRAVECVRPLIGASAPRDSVMHCVALCSSASLIGPSLVADPWSVFNYRGQGLPVAENPCGVRISKESQGDL
jgi:hypothetical protein